MMRLAFLLFALISLAIVEAQPDIRPSAHHHPCSTNEAFLHDHFFYQIFDCPMTWNDAEEMCKSNMVVRGRPVLGGHLVSILSQEDSDWLKFQLEMHYGRAVGVWIGMKRAPHRSTACPDPEKWTDGSDLSYTNYLDGQPNCRWPGEDCYHIIDNEHWNDAECQTTMRFVCKVPPTHGTPEEATLFATEAPIETVGTTKERPSTGGLVTTEEQPPSVTTEKPAGVTTQKPPSTERPVTTEKPPPPVFTTEAPPSTRKRIVVGDPGEGGNPDDNGGGVPPVPRP